MFKLDKILDGHQSDPKPKRKSTYLKESKRLPYPIPLINNAGFIQFPLDKLKAVIYFNCYLDYDEKCCEISDESSIHALYYHGYFGKGSLSSNAPVYEIVPEIVAQSRLSKDQRKKQQHEITLEKAFPSLPPINKIIDQLYQSTQPFANSFDIKEITDGPWYSLDSLTGEMRSRETLRISFEETFFLAYCLGCITVTDSKTGRKLNLTEIWQAFCSLHCPDDPSQFASLYAAYHYFRSKGWVVKSGTKFGCHFLLYKEGPAHFHGLFSVTISSVKSNETIENKYPSRDWQYLSAWNRLSEGVSKYPVLCVVVIPENLTNPEIVANPLVIQTFEIKTMVLRRFHASQERKARHEYDG